MNTTTILSNLLEKKGQFGSIKYQRRVKTRKAFEDVDIVKKTKTVFRAGIKYDNIGKVIDKRESGELPATNAGLNGFIWIAYPYLLKSLKNDELYVRLYPSNSVPHVEYYMNGQLVDKHQIEHMLLASETKEKKPDCFNVKLSDIEELE